MTDYQGQPDSALLREGAKSYPQALAALSEFRNEVMTACRKAVESELASISRTIGVKLSRVDLVDRIEPFSLEKADGENASIGLRIKQDSEGWRQYFHLIWYKDGLGASSSIWFRDKTLATKVFEALRTAQPNPPYSLDLEEEDEVYLMRRITSDEMARLQEILQELNREWVRLWQSVGGLKRCQASPSAKRAAHS
jgi:hypothetical protein